MPDITLTRKICESLHRPGNIKERFETIGAANSNAIGIKGVEKKRSDYQEPNLWVDWRVS